MKPKFLFFPLLLSSAAFAQDSSFQIKDFKFRTPRYRALGLGINFSGSIGDSKSSNSLTDKSFSLSPSQVSYYTVVSTDRELRQTYLNASTDGYFRRVTNDNKLVTNNSVRGVLNLSTSNQYFNATNRFFEVGINLSTQGTRYARKDSMTKSKSYDDQSIAQFVLGIGKGRLEQVQDAQLAVFILNDLKAQGLLSATLSSDNLFAFAHLVTLIKNKRVLDFRRKRIYELTQIDSFLRSTGIITNPDIRHFTTINDNWMYALVPSRLSGTSWYLRLKPGVSYRHYKQEDFANVVGQSTLNKETGILLTPVVGVERHVPVNVKWQHDMGVSVAYEGTKFFNRLRFNVPGSSTANKFDIFQDIYSLKTFYGIGYFPNSRTQLLGNLDLYTDYNPGNYWLYSSALRVSANYFISYRTYFSAGYELLYDYTVDKTGLPNRTNRHSFNTSLNLGLNYQLF